MESICGLASNFPPIFVSIVQALLVSEHVSFTKGLEIKKKTRIGKKAFLNGLIMMPLIHLDDLKDCIVSTGLITKYELNMLINECMEQ